MSRQRIAVGLGCAWSLVLLSGYGAFWVNHLAEIKGPADTTEKMANRDFVVFWSSAIGVAQGRTLDLYGEESYDAFLAELLGYPLVGYAWVHPPQALFVVRPLAGLPYLWAFVAWLTTTFALYLLVARRAVLLCAPSTFFNSLLGQMGFLTAAIYLGALRLLQSRPAMAGLCFGLLAIKPQLGLMVPVALLAARAWRTIATAAATVVVLIGLTALAFGWDAWAKWVTEALPRQASWLQGGLAMDLSVAAFSGALLAGLPPWAAWLCQIPCTMFAAAATWWAFAHRHRDTLSPESAAAILLLATCLATPYMLVHDLALASPVALYGFARWRQRPWTRSSMGLADLGEGAVWCLLWMLPFLSFFLNNRGVPVGSIVLAVALALCVLRAMEEVATAARQSERSRTKPNKSASSLSAR